MKCDLTEWMPCDANIPEGIRALFDAMAKRAKARFELVGYQALEGFDHDALMRFCTCGLTVQNSVARPHIKRMTRSITVAKEDRKNDCSPWVNCRTLLG